MSELPSEVVASKLWHRLAENEHLQRAIEQLRSTAEVIGAKAAQIVPEFTDHSARHMDALWRVTDAVLIDAEFARLTPSEAFVLGCSFYVHDLGMSIAATADGVAQLKASANYAAAYEQLTSAADVNESDAGLLALKIATRELHAKFSEKFIDERLPGLDRYLIESKDIRDQWGAFIGQVAASHHWPLREVDTKLGARGAVPDPLQTRTDLAFVACILRVVDYAHINAERALRLDRVLRSDIPPTSLLHWQAQENITGPLRQGHLLEFGSTRPIDTVAGWWTFFEMVRGLDSEIKDVAEYLAARQVSAGRFSLEGIRGATSPRQFATFVQTNGFEPIDVRLRSSSMDRLVNLLGGETLYGNDLFAAVRELIQNAADAVRLRWAVERAADLPPREGQIEVSIDTCDEGALLTIIDDGIGMSERVVTQYLLGVASDYWHSSDFNVDHPGARGAGFQPVGRFGIGFLSVFMLGSEVEVITQRSGEDALHLQLEGVGSRGALTHRTPSLRGGTTVRVRIGKTLLPRLVDLASGVQERAPMLDVPIVIRSGNATTKLEPKWWSKISQDEFKQFIKDYNNRAKRSRHENDNLISTHRHLLEQEFLFGTRTRAEDPLSWWPGSQPEFLSDSMRVMAVPTAEEIILCARGFAVSVINAPGFMGMLDDPDVKMNAARNRPLEMDRAEIRELLKSSLMPSIKSALNRLNEEPSIPDRYEFLVKAAKAYGSEVLLDTELRWISVLESPGEGRLIAPKEFLQRVGREREIVVGYKDIGLWSMSAAAREHCPDASPHALKVLVNGRLQADLRRDEPYHERELRKRMPLADHLRQYSCIPPERAELNFPPLLIVILELIAQAWSIAVQDLTGTQWSSRKEVLCGHLTR